MQEDQISVKEIPKGIGFLPSVNVCDGEAVLSIENDSENYILKIDTSKTEEPLDETKPTMLITEFEGYVSGLDITVDNIDVEGDIWTINGSLYDRIASIILYSNIHGEYGSLE